MRNILISTCLFALCALLQGAARVDAIVDKNIISANDVIKLQIQIVDDTTGSNTPQMIIPKFPNDFAFQILRQVGPSSSTQSSMQIINGKVDQSTTVTQTMIFLLKPKSKGTLMIPELQFSYGKEKLRTKSIKIQVSDAQSPQSKNANNTRQTTANARVAPIFTQEFSDENVIAGTPLTLKMTVMIPVQMNARSISPEFDFHDLENDFRVEWPEDLSRWADLPMQIINGIQYHVIGKELRVTPRRPGKITLAPKAMTIIYRDPSGGRRRGGFFDAFFDDPFFGGAANLQTTVATEEATLNVLDFPEEGKPANFSGLTGPLNATASIDLPEAQVGDPITLTITLKGNYVKNGDNLPSDIEAQLEQKGLFRVSGDDTIAEQEDGSFTCTRTIRALSEQASEIPPVEIPYYNIKTHAYEHAETNAIRVTIEATKEITLKNSGTLMTPVAVQPMRSPAEETALTQQEGIYLETDASLAASNTWSPINGNSGKKGLVLYFAIPALLWALAAGVTVLHKRTKRLSPAELASRNALRKLKSALNKIDLNSSDAAIRLNAALQDFLSAKLGRKGAVTATDLDEAEIAQKKADSFKELMSQCEAAQYGGFAIQTTGFKERILNAARDF